MDPEVSLVDSMVRRGVYGSIILRGSLVWGKAWRRERRIRYVGEWLVYTGGFLT